MTTLPKGQYNVRISDAVIAAVGEAAAMKCIKTVSGNIDKHCKAMNTQFGPTLHCRCKGSKGTVLDVLIYEAADGDTIDCRLPYEFGFGN